MGIGIAIMWREMWSGDRELCVMEKEVDPRDDLLVAIEIRWSMNNLPVFFCLLVYGICDCGVVHVYV